MLHFIKVGLFIFLIPSLLFSCNCFNAKQSETNTFTSAHKADTLVGLHAIPRELSAENYSEKEYFLIHRNDTSSFSCIISENKMSKKLSMSFEYSPDKKMPTSYSLTDTNAVSEQAIIKKPYKELSYKEQIKELKFILNFISKKYNISNLESIKMSMLSFKEFSLNITKEYLNQYGEKFNDKSRERIKKLIEKSEFALDINKTLLPYSLVADEVSIIEFVYYAPQYNAIENKNQKKIIDGMIRFSLRNVAEN